MWLDTCLKPRSRCYSEYTNTNQHGTVKMSIARVHVQSPHELFRKLFIYLPHPPLPNNFMHQVKAGKRTCRPPRHMAIQMDSKMKEKAPAIASAFPVINQTLGIAWPVTCTPRSCAAQESIYLGDVHMRLLLGAYTLTSMHVCPIKYHHIIKTMYHVDRDPATNHRPSGDVSGWPFLARFVRTKNPFTSSLHEMGDWEVC